MIQSNGNKTSAGLVELMISLWLKTTKGKQATRSLKWLFGLSYEILLKEKEILVKTSLMLNLAHLRHNSCLKRQIPAKVEITLRLIILF
jgi:hypothetical protein